MLRSVLFFSLIMCLVLSCKEEAPVAVSVPGGDIEFEAIKDLFEFIPAEQSGVLFNNHVGESSKNLIFAYEYAFNGGGVAIGDINNDGLQDILLSGTLVDNKLYLNMGNWTFRDITQIAGINNGFGINTGVTMVDINNDGWLDIYVCKSGTLNNPDARRNCLYINQQNMSFVDEAAAYGLNDPSFSTQTYFADFDLDGDLDAYVVNHPINWGKQNNLDLRMDESGQVHVVQDTQRQYISDRFYINEKGRFIDRTFQFGIDNSAFGLSAIVHDFNGDNYPDIYLCNDYLAPDRFLINNKGKSFSDELYTYFDNSSNSSMGSELLDVNNDGQMDMFVSDMMQEDIRVMKQQPSFINYDLFLTGRKYGYHDQFKYNAMHVMMEDGKFSNMSFLTKSNRTEWSWAALGADFDHNTTSDLFITNGYLIDVTNMDYAKFRLDSLRRAGGQNAYDEWLKIIDSLQTKNRFLSNHGQFGFADVSKEWNSGPPSFSNGAAYGDLDNDGDLDIVVNNLNAPAFVMKNKLDEKSPSGHLRLQLKSAKNTYNALVTLHMSDGMTMSRNFYPTRGFLSSVEPYVHFGYSASATPAMVEVKWPDGRVETFDQLPNSGTVILEQNTGKAKMGETPDPKALFVRTSFFHKHMENEYIDFKKEPLLHLKNSAEGPCMTEGDFDGDGTTDLVVGGSHGQPTALFLTSGNQLKLNPRSGLGNEANFEDVDIQAGDLDGDGDQDIVVLSGGYQWPNGSEMYGVRIYINNGDATFSYLPVESTPQTNCNALVLLDVDGDKDLDIAVGGGAVPGSYPFSNNSYFLINNGLNFQYDDGRLPQKGGLGLIKDMITADIDDDGTPELIIAGEWMEIKILKNNQGVFADITSQSGLNGLTGWWQCLSAADIDGDGDLDLIAGNLGLNSFFQASSDRPTCIYASDFDNNGENDAIMCTYFGDKSYPVHSRDELLEHMTSLRKKYLRYKNFSDQDIVDIFGQEKVDKAAVFTARTFESAVFLNDNGKFRRISLPREAQVSMVRGIAFIDADGDGREEMLLAGNFWDTDFDFGKYDASVGLVLKPKKDGQFEIMRKTGFTAAGNVRSLLSLDNNRIVVGENNNGIYTFERAK